MLLKIELVVLVVCCGPVSGRGCGCGLEPGGGCSGIGALDNVGIPVGTSLTCWPRLVINFGIVVALMGFAFSGGVGIAAAPPIVGVAFCCCCCTCCCCGTAAACACGGGIGVGVAEILCSVGMVGGGALPLPPGTTTDVEAEESEGGGGMAGLLRAG